MHFEVHFNCTAEAHLPRYEEGLETLSSGTHDITYVPTRDYRKVFGAESRLE